VFGQGVLESPGVKAIAKEIFGAAGYKDGERFLEFGPPGQEGQDPEKQQMQQYIQQLQQQLQESQSAVVAKQIDAQTKLQIAGMDQQTEQMRASTEMQKAKMGQDTSLFTTIIKAQSDQNNTMQEQQFQHAMAQQGRLQPVERPAA
jgi:GTPase involved in cell partitioning and DNA repair